MNYNLIGNRYNVINTLGEGGMGTVFLVEDIVRNNHLYALKTIKSTFLSSNTENSLQRFKTEYDIMTRLKHPNLAKVFDFGQDKDGNCFIVMEYIEGISLRDFFKEKTKLDIDLALSVMVPLLRAFEFMHSRNIIYRDLKPENIVITIENNQIASVKILDFGLSDLGMGEIGKIKGTINYIAPEVINGQEVDSRSDIFSLGALFYELITTSFIYKDSSANSILNSLINDNSFKESINISFELSSHEVLKPIIEKMIAFNKKDRYQCCLEIIDDINNLLKLDFPLETRETEQAYVLGVNFVSRENELEILKKICSGGAKKIHMISGPTGIGKSRLVEEFGKYCSLNNVAVYSGHSENSLAYEPFLEILNDLLFHIEEKELPEFSGYLKMFIPDHPKLMHFSTPKKYDHKTTKGILIQLISDLIISHAEKHEKKTILLFSAFNNIDEISLELIETLINKIQENEKLNKLILITECRPDKQQKITAFLTRQNEKDNINTIELKPLNSDEVTRYIFQMFGNKKIHSSITQNIDNIRELVGGNPLFLQELLKLLVTNQFITRSRSYWTLQKPIDQIEIPSTIKQIVYQRLKQLNLNKTDQKAFNIIAVLHKSSLTLDYLNLMTTGLIEINWETFLNHLVDNDFLVEKDKVYYQTNMLVSEILLEKISNKDFVQINRFFALRLADIYQVTTENTEKLSDDELYEITYHFNNAFSKTEIDLAETILKYQLVSAMRCSLRFAYNKAFKYFNRILEIAESTNFGSDTIVRIYLTAVSEKGTILLNINSIKDAEQTLLEGISKFENSSCIKEIADIKSCLSRIYQRQSEYKKSLKYNLESKILYETLADNDGISSYYSLLGLNFARQGNYQEALANYIIALDYLKNTKNSKKLGICYIDAGNVYWFMGDYQNALAYYEKQLKICQDENNLDGLGRALGNIGMVYNQLHKYNKALSYLKRAVTTGEIIGDKYQISHSYNNIGNLHLCLGNYRKALVCCAKSKKMTEEGKDIYGLACLNCSTASAYEGLNDPVKAELFFNKAIKIAESINAKFLQCEFSIIKAIFLYDQKSYDKAASVLKDIEKSVTDLQSDTISSSYQTILVFVTFFVSGKSKKVKTDELLAETEKLILQKTAQDLEGKADIYFKLWKVLSENCTEHKFKAKTASCKENAVQFYTELSSKSKFILYSKRLEILTQS